MIIFSQVLIALFCALFGVFGFGMYPLGKTNSSVYCIVTGHGSEREPHGLASFLLPFAGFSTIFIYFFLILHYIFQGRGVGAASFCLPGAL
jgi:hypothetical protein